MTSSNGNISHVTGLCVGNSPVTGEFPSQGPVTRSFDVFFDLRQNTRLCKQSRRRWFDTLSRSLWRHCNVYPSYYVRTGSFIIIPVSTPRTESICRFSTLLKMRKTTRRNKNVTHPIWIHFPCICPLQINKCEICHQCENIYHPDMDLHHYSDVVVSAMTSQITSVSIVYSNICSGADQRKHQSSAPLAFVRRIRSPLTGEFPTQRASSAKNVSIWWRHHALGNQLWH